MPLTKEQEEALKLFNDGTAVAAPSAPAATGLTPEQQAALKALNAPPEASPYANWDMTMLKQIGKVLGTSAERIGTDIMGMPGSTGEMYNSVMSAVPDVAKPFAAGAMKIANPAGALLGAANSAGLLPSTDNMNKYLEDKGVMHKPINAGEDWAQYLIPNTIEAAIPFTKGATLKSIGKEVIKSFAPAVAGKLVADNTESKGAGLTATLLTALAQHGAGQLVRPDISVSKQVARDMPTNTPELLAEARNLDVPSRTVDFVAPNTSTKRRLQDIVSSEPEKSATLMGALKSRNDDAVGRVTRYIEDAMGMGKTAPGVDDHIAQLNAAKDSQVDEVYRGIQNSTADSNHATAGAMVNKLLEGRSRQLTPLQAVADKVRKLIYQQGGRDTPGVDRLNYESRNAIAARKVIEDAIEKDPNLKDALMPIHDELTNGIAYSHPEIHGADEAAKQIAARKAALKAGQEGTKQASKSAIKTYTDFRKVLEPDQANNLQNSYRIGYAGDLVKKVEGVKPGSSATAPISGYGQGKKMPVILGDDVVKQRDFETLGHEAYRSLTDRKGDTPGIVHSVLNKIGQGSFSLGNWTYGMSNVAAHPGIAMAAMGAGLVNFLRRNATNKEFLHAAGIDTKEELAKFLAKGKKASTLSGNLGRAGILYQLNNH
jgi:hypothetical protein